MKNLNIILLGVLFLFLSSFSKNESLDIIEKTKKFIVVLDPGHGGFDTGTRTQNKIFEKDINLFIAKYIEIHLQKFAPEIEVILTRENDKFIELKKRPLYAKITHADLFISIHCNHNKKNYAKGLEIYIQKTDFSTSNINLKKAHLFAFILDEIITNNLKYRSRGIKYKNLSVLRNSIKFIPSVLIEVGFFSNQNDASYLTSKKGMEGIALAVSKSIIKYFE